MSDMARVIVPEDRRLFSLHEEDDEPESLFHSTQLEYLGSALRFLLPEHFVARNMGVYWVPGQYEHPYVGPDLLVSRHTPAAREARQRREAEARAAELAAEVERLRRVLQARESEEPLDPSS